MKKLIALILAIILVTAVAFAELAETEPSDAAETVAADAVVSPEPTQQPGRLAGITIGIDPGHQAHQNSERERVSPKGKEKKAKVASGTSGKSTRVPEYQCNLEISLMLRDALIAEGATVVMTRDTNDVDISNYERAMMMNDSGAQLVLRLHCNGSTNSKANGTALYVRKSIAYGKDVVPDPKTLLNEETTAAQIIVNSMCASTGAKNLGVIKRDSYTMNNWSTVPIILVEMGYMSNKAEDEKLNDPAYQALLVEGMVNGICEYFGR